MADTLQAYKVAANEQSSSSKFNNLVQAVEDGLNSVDNTNITAGASVAVSKLAAGSNGDVLTTAAGIPAWVAPTSGATYQTTLPGAPANGQVTYLVDSTTAPTYCWALRYNSAKSSNKWDFVGGSPVTVVIATDQTTGSAALADLATVGPSFTIPVAGQYDFVYSCAANNTGGNDTTMGLVKNGVAMTSAYAEFAAATSRNATMAGQWAASGFAAADVVKLMYATTSPTAHFLNRVLRVTPIAIGG